MRSLSTVVAGLALLGQGVSAAFDAESSSNVAVYWGQNSGSSGQQRLSAYCDRKDIDIIPIAFLTSFDPPTVNLANAAFNCTATDGNERNYCQQLEEDITSCQEKNKTILLSIGGQTFSDPGFETEEDAAKAANLLWKMFGPVDGNDVPKKNNKTVTRSHRPFGDAVLNGFDLDFESPVANANAFARRLRQLVDEGNKKEKDGVKRYFLSATPQCQFPDVNQKSFLQGGVDQKNQTAVPLDFVMVQFYNNDCGVSRFQNASESQRSFNFEEWDAWAKASANPEVRVLLGLPASEKAGQGYVNAEGLEEVIEYSSQFDSFGGVMFWDMAQLFRNEGLLEDVANILANEEAESCDVEGEDDDVAAEDEHCEEETEKDDPKETEKKEAEEKGESEGKEEDEKKDKKIDQRDASTSKIRDLWRTMASLVRQTKHKKTATVSTKGSKKLRKRAVVTKKVYRTVYRTVFAAVTPTDGVLMSTGLPATTSEPPVVTDGPISCQCPPVSDDFSYTTPSFESSSYTQNVTYTSPPLTTSELPPVDTSCLSHPASFTTIVSGTDEPTTTITTTSTTTATTTQTTTIPTEEPTQPSQLRRQWQQCGGREYNGPTQCEQPWTCVYVAEWWSHCN